MLKLFIPIVAGFEHTTNFDISDVQSILESDQK